MKKKGLPIVRSSWRAWQLVPCIAAVQAAAAAIAQLADTRSTCGWRCCGWRPNSELAQCKGILSPKQAFFMESKLLRLDDFAEKNSPMNSKPSISWKTLSAALDLVHLDLPDIQAAKCRRGSWPPGCLPVTMALLG